MTINVIFFATVRELAGVSEVSIELSHESTGADLWDELRIRYPQLAPMRNHTAIAVNSEYAHEDVVLSDGDEVALIPPVSGGSGDFFELTDQTIPSLSSYVASPTSGAIATFDGVVRNNLDGRAVERLEYEAFAPMAKKVMVQIAEEVRQKWDVDRIAIVHRTGLLIVGETSVAIAVSSPHRKEALESCHYIIDRIKEILPVWKKEFFSDGQEWVEGSTVVPD